MRDQPFPGKNVTFTGPRELRLATNARSRYASKHDFGSLLIVGGSGVYSGAPALAGMAALRTGVGLSVVAAPKSVANVIRSYSPNLIVHPLQTDCVTPANLSMISELLNKANALVLGPGIGMHEETISAIPLIITKARELQKPTLVDADGIRALKDSQSLLKGMVITPHVGEFKAVSGVEAPAKWRDRLEICKSFARKHACILLLKGHDTVVTDGVRFKVNRTGNPGMAIGGMGDVLSGIVGAYLAQGIDPFLSAVAGAYVHGLAGDRARKRKGFHMVASDLIETLPEVLKPYDRISD